MSYTLTDGMSIPLVKRSEQTRLRQALQVKGAVSGPSSAMKNLPPTRCGSRGRLGFDVLVAYGRGSRSRSNRGL